MKKCEQCNKVYKNNVEFCIYCGSPLKSKNNYKVSKIANKKSLLFISIAIVVICLIVGIIVKEKIKLDKTRTDIENYRYNKQLEEYMNTPTTDDLKVNSGWKAQIKGNYIYINGSVKNTSSSKTISYFEVEAKFYDDSGNVIDSDYTNDGEDLLPGESRQFQIMHKYSSRIKKVNLFVDKVK